jgi:translation initiation factor IF-3
MAHPERGEMILNRLAEDLGELATIEQRPQQDGRNMTMMLGPTKAALDEGAARPAETPPAKAEKPRRAAPQARAAGSAEPAEVRPEQI